MPTFVRELMTTRHLKTIREQDSVALGAQLMLWSGVRHLPVVRGGEVVGIVSEGDILAHRAARGADGPPGAPPVRAGRDVVGEIMSKAVQVTTPDEDLARAAAVMAAGKLGCLPVVEHGRLVGILTTTDIVGWQVSSSLRREGRATRRAVRDVMRPSPHTIGPEQDLLDAVDLMRREDIRHLPVVDGDGHLRGMLSDRDLRAAVGDPAHAVEAWAEGRGPQLTVASAMTPATVVAHAGDPVDACCRRMIDWRIGAIPVVDADDRLVGIVSYVDLLERR